MNPRHKILAAGVTGFCLLAWAPAGRAEDAVAASRLDPGRLTLGVSASENIRIYAIDTRIPLWKPGRSMLFLNPRGVFLDDDEQEASLGLIARHLWHDRPLILGFNTFYDARWTAANNTFGQVGGGLELLSRWIDARANYYYPLTDPKILRSYESTTVEVSGRQRITTRSRFQDLEEALEGLDAEIGLWLPYLSRLAPTAVLVGYYDFKSDLGASDVSGIKLRLESRLHPNLTLDAEWFEDKAYAGSEYFVGLRLHLPLDLRRGPRLHRSGAEAGRVPLFASRMADPVQRDFRMRIQRTEGLLQSTQSSTEFLAPRPSPPPMELVCYDVVTLDNEGNVVIIRICE